MPAVQPTAGDEPVPAPRALTEWRTFAVALIGVLGEAARRRLAPAPPRISDSEREEPFDVNHWRWLLAVGPALIVTLLRRRLAS